MKPFRHLLEQQKSRFFILFRFLAEFTSRASSLILFPLMARSLHAEGYGVYTQTNVIISFLVPIAALGLGYGVVRLVAGSTDKRFVSARFFTSVLLAGGCAIAISVLIFLLAPVLNALFIKVDFATAALRWAAPLVFFSAMENTCKDYYRARLRIIAYSVLQIIQTVVYLAALWLVLVNGGDVINVIQTWLAVKCIFVIVQVGYLFTSGDLETSLHLMPREEAISLVRFGLPVVVMGAATWFISQGDRWVIGYYMNAADVGIYNAAYTLASVLPALASPFWVPMYPVMAAHFNRKNPEGMYQACRKYTNGFCLIGLPAMAGLFAIGSRLLAVMGSDEFTVAAWVLVVITFGLFVDQFSSNAHYLVYLHNDPGYMRNVTISSGLLNLVLNLILIPLIGFGGAAISTLVAYLFMDALLFRKVILYRYSIRALYDFPNLLKFLAASAGMGAAGLSAAYFFKTDVLHLAGIMLGCVIIYVLLLLALYRFNFRRILEIF